MNYMIKSLLVAALAVSASHVSAFSNKTFLSPRAQAANITLDSVLARELVSANKHDRFGANIMATGYYSESINASRIGKYLGITDNSASFDAVISADAANYLLPDTLDLGSLVHDHVAAAAAAAAAHGARINLSPKTMTMGIELAYAQCLGKILDGLHLSVSLPVERVENNMNMTVTNPRGAGDDTLIKDFFAGKVDRPALGNAGYQLPAGFTPANNAQAALKNALIDGKKNATGLADVQVALGYDVWRNQDWVVGFNVGGSIPTGNAATGKNLFEPIYGSKHVKLGLGGSAVGTVWRDGDHRLWLNASIDYRYALQANEVRTLSIIQGIDAVQWGQYYLVAFEGGAKTSALPLANIATVPVSVAPGHSLRGNMGINYRNGGFVIGMAYAPAIKQAEKITRSARLANEDTLLNINDDFDLTGTGVFVGADGTPLKGDAQGIDLNRSSNPAQIVHRFGGDFGYTFKSMYCPVTIGAGAHYEASEDNAAVDNWGVSIKAGIGF